MDSSVLLGRSKFCPYQSSTRPNLAQNAKKGFSTFAFSQKLFLLCELCEHLCAFDNIFAHQNFTRDQGGSKTLKEMSEFVVGVT